MNYENYSQCGKRSVPNLIIGKKILKCMWKMSIKDLKRYKCDDCGKNFTQYWIEGTYYRCS